MSLRLDWCSHEAAKYACENWHYSKSIPVPPLVKIGAWEDNKFIGAVIFSRGASSNSAKLADCRKVFCEGKHRYLYPLTDEIKNQIIKLSKPYPKRASSVESGTSEFHSEGGGASPTDALHTEVIIGET